MGWMAEISKEEAVQLLQEREKTVEANFKRTRQAVHKDDVASNHISSLTKCCRKVSEAWERIKDNTFGICLTCQKPIPEEQVRINPERDLCVPCKNSKNKKPRKSFI